MPSTNGSGGYAMKPTYERFAALVDALMMAIEAKSEYRSFVMTRIAEQLAIGFTHEKVEEAKFHVRTDFGSVIVDASGKGEARAMVAKKLKGGYENIRGVFRVGVSKAKQIQNKL